MALYFYNRGDLMLTYKVFEASNEIPSYAFEEIEAKINRAAKVGFRLDNVELTCEDRGDSQTRLYYVVAVMSMTGKKNKHGKKSKKDKNAKKVKATETVDEPDKSN